MHSLPHHPHPPPDGAFVTNDEPALTRHHHSGATVYLWADCCTFCGLGQMSNNMWDPVVAQTVKNPPEMQEMQEIRVRPLGWEDSLEKGMATHSSILACGIPWTEEPGGLQSLGSQRVRHNRDTNTFTSLS